MNGSGPGTRVTFLRRLGTTLDASDSLLEIVVGLVVIIGVTSSSRLGFVDSSGHDAVLFAALACALAWAIIDGSFYLITSVYRQGRVGRLARRLRAGGVDAATRRDLDAIVGSALGDVLDDDHRDAVYAMVASSERMRPQPVRLTTDDWMAALAAAVAMLLATLPPIVPFLLPLPAGAALAASNLISVASLFWVGWFWARWTYFPRWLCGLGLALIGIAMVALTVAFGVA